MESARCSQRHNELLKSQWPGEGHGPLWSMNMSSMAMSPGVRMDRGLIQAVDCFGYCQRGGCIDIQF